MFMTRQITFTIFFLLCLVSKASGTTWDYQGYIAGCGSTGPDLCSVVPIGNGQNVVGFITLDIGATGSLALPHGFTNFDLDVQPSGSNLAVEAGDRKNVV